MKAVWFGHEGAGPRNAQNSEGNLYQPGVKQTSLTGLWCPVRVCINCPEGTSNNATVPSMTPHARRFPSGLYATLSTNFSRLCFSSACSRGFGQISGRASTLDWNIYRGCAWLRAAHRCLGAVVTAQTPVLLHVIQEASNSASPLTAWLSDA